jgi:hypothetical protein
LRRRERREKVGERNVDRSKHRKGGKKSKTEAG